MDSAELNSWSNASRTGESSTAKKVSCYERKQTYLMLLCIVSNYLNELSKNVSQTGIASEPQTLSIDIFVIWLKFRDSWQRRKISATIHLPVSSPASFEKKDLLKKLVRNSDNFLTLFCPKLVDEGVFERLPRPCLQTWDLFGFNLFTLSSSALDHSATASPLSLNDIFLLRLFSQIVFFAKL